MNESDAETDPIAPAGIERRRVLKIAAWATPAVMLMTAAPAFATSKPGVLKFDTTPGGWFGWTGGQRSGLEFQTQLQNTSDTVTVSSLTVTFTLPAGFDIPKITYTGDGWSLTSTSATTLSFTYGKTIRPYGSTSTLLIKVSSIAQPIVGPVPISWVVSSPSAGMLSGNNSGSFSIS